MFEYRRSSHAVFRLRFHFVFNTRYRNPGLKGDIAKEIRKLTKETCSPHDIEIVKGPTRPDHIHIMFDVPPRMSSGKVVQAIKGETSHHILQDNRRQRREFWRRPLRAKGYLVATTRTVRDEAVAQYIECQVVESEDNDFKITQ